MRNRCPTCKRDFSSDLKFCPNCHSPAKPERTSKWRYDEPGLIRHTTPDEDAARVCMRQNAYVLFCCVVLLVPPIWVGIDSVRMMIMDGQFDHFSLTVVVYAAIVVPLILYGLIQAWKGERPAYQITAAALIWMNTSFIQPIVFLVSGLAFSLVLGIAASKTNSFTNPDPSYLVVLSGIALMDIILAYLWLLTSPMESLGF
jgi:hypothetical protein